MYNGGVGVVFKELIFENELNYDIKKSICLDCRVSGDTKCGGGYS